MKTHIHLTTWIIIFAIVISTGAYAYYLIEGWSLIDSFYFVVVTSTTVGYGDIVPITHLGKYFTMFYSFFGFIMAFYLISVINSFLFKKHVGQRISKITQEVELKSKEEDMIRAEKRQILKARRKKR